MVARRQLDSVPETGGLFLITPDGKTIRKLTERKLQTYGFARNGGKVYGWFESVIWEGIQSETADQDNDFGVRSVELLE